MSIKYISREEKNGITQELLKCIFNYHIDGYFTWKKRPANNKVKLGQTAGYILKTKRESRRRIKINNVYYYASRLIFLYHHGWLPTEVDHENRDTLDNRIQNLRASTKSQNQKNRKSAKNSTSKFLGVYLQQGKYWTAQIKTPNKQLHLGTFKTEEDAARAYNEAAKIHHGEFANLNVI